MCKLYISCNFSSIQFEKFIMKVYDVKAYKANRLNMRKDMTITIPSRYTEKYEEQKSITSCFHLNNNECIIKGHLWYVPSKTKV